MPAHFYATFLLLLAMLLPQHAVLPQYAPPRAPIAPPQTLFAPLAVADGAAAGALPLVFTPNVGQSQDGWLYQVQTPHSLVSFGAGGTSFALAGADLTLNFYNSNPQARISGAQQLPTQVNYYTGSDPSAWKTGIAGYQEIRYDELYPGVMLSYGSAGGQLKSTYTLSPGVDPGLIRWGYSGAQSVQVDAANGSLIVALPGSQIHLEEQAPLAWQITNGRQVPVSAAYQVSQAGAVSFKLGAFDRSLPLTIDPVLSFSTYMAGNKVDLATAVTTDALGNVYVAGYTRSTTFMGVPGATGTEDTWIAKLNPQGTALLYLTYLTGTDAERPTDLALDGSGNLYIAGYTGSGNFPTLNPAQPALAGGWDFYVTKLNGSGQIAYSTFLGTELTEFPEAIALGPDGSVHVAGQISGKGGLFKLAANGSLLYGIVFGGTGYGETNAKGLAVNQNGQVYMTGTTSHKDLDLTPDSMQTLCDGVNDEYRGCRGDAYLLKLSNAQDIAGLSILYNTYFGGLSFENVEDMALGSDGSVRLVGQTISSNFPTTANALAKTCPSGIDASNTEQCTNYEAFYTSISPSLNQVLYSTYIGGDWKETAVAVGLDGAGAAYVAGWTEGNDWPMVNQLQNHASRICYDIYANPRFCIDSFVVKFNPSGAVDYSTYLGGADEDDFIYEIVVEAGGSATVVGSTLAATFPTTPGTVQSNLPFPGQNGFAAKISSGGAPPPGPCYTLTRNHSGSGSAPAANPANSAGCAAGQYKAGEVIGLTASPAAGWTVGSWTGANTSSTATTNQVTMPAANHTVQVNYIRSDQTNFDFFTYLPFTTR